MIDAYGRNIDYMRVSITDRCNLRCVYCMPHDVPDIPHQDVLRYEEIIRICRIMAGLGIKYLRITGGEPLVRKGCADLIAELKRLPGIENVVITTNGILFPKFAHELIAAGLDGVNLSVDTLDETVYKRITGADGLKSALEAVDIAIAEGLRVKINCVPARELNGSCILSVAKLAERFPVDVRFIELMPKGFGSAFNGISPDEILAELKTIWPELVPEAENAEKRGFGPAKYYRCDALKGSIGLITAISGHFCNCCNRLRLTSDGFLKLCLYHADGIDLRGLMRLGADDGEIESAVLKAVALKPEKHFFNENNDNNTNAPSREVMSKIGG